MNSPLCPKEISIFRRKVYRYSKLYGRSTLPWRKDYDPYHILVSEIMLQQTPVDRVIGKFSAFIGHFPDIKSLAGSPLNEVLVLWQGLGYNRRAAALRETAKIIVRDFDCIVPNSPEKLRMLPGIGPATAASIAAFAYNQPIAFLETNIRTVFIHHFFSGSDAVGDDEILPLAEATLDRRNPRRWYGALMDYGSALKKTVGNLSRNSIVYKKQTPFIGSPRQVRGALLRWLINNKEGTAGKIARDLEKKRTAVAALLDKLAEEGLLKKEGQHYRIAQ
jgi:A/G-specific adenine glycosylase